MAVLFHDGEILAIVEADPPVVVVACGDLPVDLRAMSPGREEDLVGSVVPPVYLDRDFPVLAVLVLLFLERAPRSVARLGVVPDAVLDVVHRDVLRGKVEAEASRGPGRRPELDRIREVAEQACADDVVLVVRAAPPAVAADRELQQPVEEVWLGDRRLVVLDAGADHRRDAPLLPCAAEPPRLEEVEVVLPQLDHAVHRIDGAGADADREVSGAVLGDLVHEVAHLGLAVLRLAAVDLLKVVLHAIEVAQVLKAVLAALGLVGKHRIAGRERDLAAQHLVLRVVVAADEHAVDYHGHALLHRELEVDHLRIRAGRHLPDGDVRVGERLFARSAKHLHLARGLGHRGRAGDVARGERLVRGEHRVGGILLGADDGHAAHLVLHAFLDGEHAVDLAVRQNLLLRQGHLHVEEAPVAVVGGHLVASFREVLVGGWSVAEPAPWIPPRIIVEGGAQRIGVILEPTLGIPPRVLLEDRVLPPEHEGVNLLPGPLLDVHRHVHGAGEVLDRLEPVRDLHVREEFLLVRALDPARRRLEVGLAVRIAVLQLRERRDLRTRPVVVAVHVERTLEAELWSHDVGYVDALGPMLGLEDDVVVLAHVAQRAHVARALLRVELVAHLHLAASDHVARVQVRPVGHLHRDRRHLRRLRHARDRQKRRQKRYFHLATFVFEVQN